MLDRDKQSSLFAGSIGNERTSFKTLSAGQRLSVIGPIMKVTNYCQLSLFLACNIKLLKAIINFVL